MIQLLSSFFLLFCQELTFGAVLGMGFLLLNVALFLELGYLCSFGLILNVLLKGIFQVPPSFVGSFSEYAFPSGHMQLSVLFYSFLAVYFPYTIFRCFVGVVLLGIGEALVYFHFHTVIDVLGGLVTALSLLYLYETFIKKLSLEWQLIVLTGLAGVMMRWNQMLYVNVPKHAGYALIILVILTLIRPWVLRSVGLVHVTACNQKTLGPHLQHKFGSK